MSYEPSPHEFASEPVAGREIEDLVDDLARLAGSDLTGRQFHQLVLERAVEGLAAVGGAIWIRSADGQIHLECQFRLDAIPLAENWADAQRHTQLLAAVLATGEGRVIAPRATLAGEPQAINPTDYLLVLAPLDAEAGAAGLVEVFQRPNVTTLAQHGYLRFLAAIGELAAEHQRNAELRELRDRGTLWRQFERFTQQVHGSLELRAVAYTIANDGRDLIGCDRVSVALAIGSGCRLLAVSGIDKLDRRAEVVRSLEQLATAVNSAGEPFWQAEGHADSPPQLAVPLERVLDETHARGLAVLPLHRPREDRPDSPDSVSAQTDGAPIGALIIERFDGAGFDPAQRERIAAVCRQSGSALGNAQMYESVPLLPLWRTFGRVGWLAQAKQLPKTVLALALVAAAAIALMVIPADFDIAARGELQPKLRREVFARSDGIVDRIEVQQNQKVAAGDLLAILRKPQLDFEFSRLAGEIQTAQARLSAIQASRLATGRDSAANTTEKINQLSADEEEVKSLLASLVQQQKLLRAQRLDLELHSPIDGAVLTWNAKDLLAARPVARGQALLSVADTNGPWVLELQVSDNRIGHVLDAQQSEAEERKVRQGTTTDLPVSFILATGPGVTYNGKIARVALSTESDKTTGATVLVAVSFDRAEIPPEQLRPGATVMAKIHCGRRSLGYVWLHELWETIQSRLLF
ncbi:MAG TPA: biotin/lipoyl-binding protein [Pirellulales bacterium]|jgi:multidrug efflux pump subunit AcrA (membrane-fusion protein)|nr:biotin/lipoyl-binding protein [Pirellulales bacterium]